MSTATKLTSAERVLRMLERRDHDRIPRWDGYWPDTIEKWETQGLKGGSDRVYELLERDFACLTWVWPVPFPEQHEVLEENDETQLIKDNMGKIERHWKHRSGTPEHVGFDCDSQEKWEKIYKPALLKSSMNIDTQRARETYAKESAKGLFCHTGGIEAFEAMRQLVGDEVLLMAMAMEPDWILDMSKTYTDLILKELEAILASGVKPNAVWVYGDVGYNRGPFFSPQMYRDLIAKDHRRLSKFAHQNGMKFIYHTDGDVRTLIDEFVIGEFDCIQPMEAKANMDVRELAPKYGKNLSFFGNINMMVASLNDRDKLEEELKTKIQAGMVNSNYAYHSDHSVPPSVDWQTYQWIIEFVNQYGNY